MSELTSSSRSYKRILLKISGEALTGALEYGLDSHTIGRIAEDIKEIHKLGLQICLVVGGGNIFRGNVGASYRIDQPTADSMGMLATVMNALALQSALEHLGLETRVMSAISMPRICEPYSRRKALRHLEKGRIIIFSAGSGNPYFTTDTAAVLRACEMGCEVLLKGTKVDGIYSADPLKAKNAEHYSRLSYEKVLQEHLKVMDMTAITLAYENKMPLLIFSIHKPGNLADVLQGKGLFSYIHSQE